MSSTNSPAQSRRIHLLAYTCLVMIIVVLGIGRSRLQGAVQEGAASVATVGDNVISIDQVLERAAPSLGQVDGQRLACLSTARENRHQVIKNMLEVLVRENLSTIASDNAGLDLLSERSPA